MTIERTIDLGSHTIEIDNWGGVHIHYPDDHEPPVSFNPKTMEKIATARKEVAE